MNSRDSDPLSRRLKTISGDLKLYVEKRVELLLLNVGEHFSRMMAESVHKITGVVLLAAASVCLLVALALYLGDLLNSPSLGYVLVSIPLIVFGSLFLYLKPKSILERIQNHFEKEIVRALSSNGKGEHSNLQLEEPESEKEFKS